MPYIDKHGRMSLDPIVDAIVEALDNDGWHVGDINYIFTRVLDAWFRRSPKYETICNIMGTVDCVGKEFYRRVAIAYEDKKRWGNGDVYSPENVTP